MSLTPNKTPLLTLAKEDNPSPVRRVLRFDEVTRAVSYLNRSVKLTRKEYGILIELYLVQGRVCSREELLVKDWGRDVFVDVRTIDRHVVPLRRKMKSLSRKELHVDTIWGIGYRLRMVNAIVNDAWDSSPE